jgi:predicted double-glycine peptidase
MVVLAAIVVGRSRDLMWRLPASAEVAQALLQWVTMPVLLGYTAALATLIAWREAHPKRVSVSLASALVLSALVFLNGRLTRPVYRELSELETTDGVVLQTSSVSCAAAAAANILRGLGHKATEEEMAKALATTAFGTSDAAILIGLRSLGFACRKVTVSSFRDVASPAMLFVDHPATGAESHVVALASSNREHAEILDPLSGRLWMTEAQLREIWHGKALEVGE